jgi:hypothetical protein
MYWKTKCVRAGLFMVLGFSTQAKDIEFGGYIWAVRSGRGGPGPNAWDENNVWLNTSTNLHLKISQRDGKWSCAEVTMKKRLGFGRYQFQTTGRLDRFDDNVVMGLFNYLSLAKTSSGAKTLGFCGISRNPRRHDSLAEPCALPGRCRTEIPPDLAPRDAGCCVWDFRATIYSGGHQAA